MDRLRTLLDNIGALLSLSRAVLVHHVPRYLQFSKMSRPRAPIMTKDVRKELLRHFMFWRMSQAKRPFLGIRTISRQISTSPFFEDVCSGSLIFNIKRPKTTSPRSQFFEDVSGEIAILRGTFPDKNGKRRFSELACARTRMFTQRGVYVHGGAVAGLP